MDLENPELVISSSSSSSEPLAASVPAFVAQQAQQTRKDRYRDASYPLGPIGGRNWDDFANYMNLVAQRKSQLQREAKIAKDNDEYEPPGPYQGYNIGDITSLADIVGHRNKGIKFKPEWNARLATEAWLDKQRANHPDDLTWQRWGVDELDLDDDPRTPDNVVVYSDKTAGKVKAIDGYHLESRQGKERKRAYYSDYPTREERQQVDPKERSRLKAYYRKYPTKSEQIKHPLTEDWKAPQSAFNLVRDKVKELLNIVGFTIYSKNNPDGTMKQTKFMTLLGKLASIAYKMVLRAVLKRDPDDPENKTAKEQNKLKADLLEQDVNKRTLLDALIDSNYRLHFSKGAIQQILNAIGGIKYKLITKDINGVNVEVFEIEDDEVLKAKSGEAAVAPTYLTKAEMKARTEGRRTTFAPTPLRAARNWGDFTNMLNSGWEPVRGAWGEGFDDENVGSSSSSSSSSSSGPIGTPLKAFRSGLSQK
jgi:hypothetical protein